jgi:hypothetical protein
VAGPREVAGGGWGREGEGKLRPAKARWRRRLQGGEGGWCGSGNVE